VDLAGVIIQQVREVAGEGHPGQQSGAEQPELDLLRRDRLQVLARVVEQDHPVPSANDPRGRSAESSSPGAVRPCQGPHGQRRPLSLGGLRDPGLRAATLSGSK
jgi:hypothetical protein